MDSPGPTTVSAPCARAEATPPAAARTTANRTTGSIRNKLLINHSFRSPSTRRTTLVCNHLRRRLLAAGPQDVVRIDHFRYRRDEDSPLQRRLPSGEGPVSIRL